MTAYYQAGDRIRELTLSTDAIGNRYMRVTFHSVRVAEGDRIRIDHSNQWVTIDDQGVGVLGPQQIVEPDDPEFREANDYGVEVYAEFGAYPLQEDEDPRQVDEYGFDEEGEHHGHTL